jgi:hypothetical protein
MAGKGCGRKIGAEGMTVRYLSYRLALLLTLVILVPLGYWVRFSQGLIPAWLHDALGSVAYEIFWITLFALLAPNMAVQWVALGVCLATCGLEFLQLWQPPVLQMIRATLPGRLVLGNTFTWSDFPPYFVGSAVGWGWVRSLQQQRVRKFS